MKKKYLVVLALGTILALSACGSSESDSSKSTPAPNKTVSRDSQTSDDKKDENKEDENKEDETSQTEGKSEEDLRNVVNGLTSAVEMNSMFEAPAEYVTNYFGMDKQKYPASVFFISESETSAQTVILVKVDDNTKSEVESGLNSYVESKKQETNNYMPSEYEVACNAKINQVKDVMYLVMSTQVDKACEYLDKELNK